MRPAPPTSRRLTPACPGWWRRVHPSQSRGRHRYVATRRAVGQHRALWAESQHFCTSRSACSIWAGFIAWACFFHSGGDTNALKNTIVCNAFGAVCAWVAALIILSFPMADSFGLPAWAAIVVGLTVLVLCLGAHIKAFSSIPASVYGYASVFAFLLGNRPTSMTKDKLMSASLANALILVVVSMIVGAIFGLLSRQAGRRAHLEELTPGPAVVRGRPRPRGLEWYADPEGEARRRYPLPSSSGSARPSSRLGLRRPFRLRRP